MNTKKIALIVTLAAVSIGSNYAMVSIHNVKFMDLIVFVSGFCFGPIVGSLIGIISWGIYGAANPFGFSFHIWAATMFSESIYAIAGALTRKTIRLDDFNGFKSQRISAAICFGALGIFLTFAYDIITNVAFASYYDWNIPLSIVIGFVPMGIIHVASNALFFGIGCSPTITAILNVVGGDNLSAPKE
jgi:LytS/YehU family sensor histidine kinase